MDEILQEVRKVREAYAKQFNFDLQAIHRDLNEQERVSDRRIVSLAPRQSPRPANCKPALTKADNRTLALNLTRDARGRP